MRDPQHPTLPCWPLNAQLAQSPATPHSVGTCVSLDTRTRAAARERGTTSVASYPTLQVQMQIPGTYAHATPHLSRTRLGNTPDSCDATRGMHKHAHMNRSTPAKRCAPDAHATLPRATSSMPLNRKRTPYTPFQLGTHPRSGYTSTWGQQVPPSHSALPDSCSRPDPSAIILQRAKSSYSPDALLQHDPETCTTRSRAQLPPTRPCSCAAAADDLRQQQLPPAAQSCRP